jgi:hypothetical protein
VAAAGSGKRATDTLAPPPAKRGRPSAAPVASAAAHAWSARDGGVNAAEALKNGWNFSKAGNLLDLKHSTRAPWHCEDTDACRTRRRLRGAGADTWPCAMLAPCYSGVEDTRVAAINRISRFPSPLRGPHTALAFANVLRSGATWAFDPSGLTFVCDEDQPLAVAPLTPGAPRAFRTMFDAMTTGRAVGLLPANACTDMSKAVTFTDVLLAFEQSACWPRLGLGPFSPAARHAWAAAPPP